jgi:hypothetical protein
MRFLFEILSTKLTNKKYIIGIKIYLRSQMTYKKDIYWYICTFIDIFVLSTYLTTMMTTHHTSRDQNDCFTSFFPFLYQNDYFTFEYKLLIIIIFFPIDLTLELCQGLRTKEDKILICISSLNQFLSTKPQK